MKFDSISKEFLMLAENTRFNVFLTGVAGSGKSSLIDYFTSKTSKRFTLLGTTGTAAINIGGQTLHRYFGIGKNGSTRTLTKDKISHIIATDLFIIDEVSMLRADLFDTLDEVLRDATGINKLFGGKQIILVGDLLQLPPVLVRHKEVDGVKTETEEYKEFTEKYAGRFFFNASGYNKQFFKTINLQKVYRQDNQELINSLNLIRVGIQSRELLSMFNSKLTKLDKLDPRAIYIGSSNWIVNDINKRKLSENSNDDVLLSASIKGDFEKEDYPVDRWVNVKKDCRVMFTKNHPEQLYSNGTLGTLIKIDKFMLTIKLDNGTEVELKKMIWENVIGVDEFGERIVAGTFQQFPIRVAHAITIHKSQGKTFDHVVIDVGSGCFESGMLYVALSRVTSIEGLQLVRMLRVSDIKSDIDVKKFLDS